MTIQQILWTDLVPSRRNVRKVKADITSLAASMAADGLFQNLVVAPCGDGKYEVIAGERRRRAIVQLVKAGTWPRDVEIPLRSPRGRNRDRDQLRRERAACRHAPRRCHPGFCRSCRRRS